MVVASDVGSEQFEQFLLYGAVNDRTDKTREDKTRQDKTRQASKHTHSAAKGTILVVFNGCARDYRYSRIFS
jgi:hypothetical protein